MGSNDNVTNGEEKTDDINIDEWVIVNSPGGRYLGRIEGFDYEDTIEAVSNGDALKLFPCLDFLAPLRPIPQPGGGLAMQRDPIIVPVDFTLHETPVYVKVSSLYFCCDMKEADKKTYKDLARSGLGAAMHARAQQAGLTLVGAGAMPPSGKGLRG